MKARSVVLAIAAFALLEQVSALSLEEAQKRMFERNPDLITARLQVDIARSQYKEVLGQWQPTVTASASYLFQSEDQKILFPLPPPLGGLKTLSDRDRSDFWIQADYPLFTGFSRYHLTRSKSLAVEVEKRSMEATQNRLSFELGLLYYSWELSFKRVQTQESMVSQLLAYAEQSKNLVESGVATSVRYAEAQAQLRLSQAELIGYESRRDSIERELASVIQQPENEMGSPEPSQVPDTAEIAVVALFPADTARPEITRFGLSIDQLTRNRKSLTGKYLPSLFASAGYHYANPGLNLNTDEYMSYAIAGLQLNWTLYDGRRIWAQRSQTVLQEKIVQEQKRKAVAAWEKLLSSASQRLRQSQQQVRAAQEALAAARIVTADTKNRLEAGNATSLEYLTAVRNEAQVSFMVDQAEFGLKAAHLGVLYAAGKSIIY